MKKTTLALIALAGSTLLGCGGAGRDEATSTSHEGSQLTAAINTPGVIPAGLPSRMMIGLMEDSGQTWMRQSGVRWDGRYRYLTKGWANNWGWGPNDGSFALSYMRECDAQGTIPVLQYYIMNNEPGGGEMSFYSKTQNAGTMAGYFNDFKLLMQRVKDFGKPVVVLVEGDGFAYMEVQSGGNPNAYSAIAASGVPDLAGLPNTAAGWGLAFLQLRKSVGARNAILAPHVSAWASGQDLTHASVTIPLQPEVDKVHAFLAPLGLAPNVTGSTYDLLVTDPLDRDMDFYRLTLGQDRTWNASDSAPIASKSFNRYAEWLRLWNVKAQKRWLLWQIPLGNSNHANNWNDGSPRSGYKDNRPEYFFGPSRDAHLAKFAESGVIGLFFGPGAAGQSSYQNDIYTDGQPFMRSRAGAFVNAGGLTLGSGSGTTDAGAPPPPPPPADPAQYGFETDAAGFTTTGGAVTAVASTTARAFAGARSLAVTLGGAAGRSNVRVGAPAVPAGRTVSFRVLCPVGSPMTAVQPYVLQGAAGNWTFTGSYRGAAQLTAGAWNTITVAVPANAAPLHELGVEFAVNAGAASACYVDSIAW